jgi:hypothetical protein
MRHKSASFNIRYSTYRNCVVQYPDVARGVSGKVRLDKVKLPVPQMVTEMYGISGTGTVSCRSALKIRNINSIFHCLGAAEDEIHTDYYISVSK